MLSKAWNLVKSSTVEGELLRPSEVSELHNRLVRMRTKQEEKDKENLNRNNLPLNTTHDNRSTYRKGFAHWFAPLKPDYVASEAFYQDVLVKLTANGEASSLLEYERMWTRHVIRHASDHMWSADPMSSNTMSKSALENRIGTINRKLIDTSVKRICTNGSPEDEPLQLEQFNASEIKMITKQDDPPPEIPAD